MGDEILIEIDPKEFDRSSVHTAKQRAKQYLRDIQKDTLYSEFSGKENEVIIGYYQRERNGNIYVDLGHVPRGHSSPEEPVAAPAGDIRSRQPHQEHDQRSPQDSRRPARWSPVHPPRPPRFVEKLFELEVPEIYEKAILIHKIVREAGYRTKIAVRSVKEEDRPHRRLRGSQGVLVSRP